MDCCSSSSYTDYRHTLGGGANGLVNTNIPPYSHHQSHYHHNHPYSNQPNIMRYQTASMYHHGGGGVRPPPNMYDNYEQFGYQTPPPPVPPIPPPSPLPPYAYNGNHFPYNQRDVGFYGHSHHHPHHPYEGSPYRMSPMYPPSPYHHGHHIHRNGSIGPIGNGGPPEHYSSDMMYGLNRANNSYLMRDTPLPPYHQYGPFHHTNPISREFYAAQQQQQQHSMPNSVSAGGQSTFVDTNCNNNGSVHNSNGSICGEYPTAPATPYPSSVGPLNAFSSTNLNSTVHGPSTKDSKPRKGLRDKNLNKLVAMNRKLEGASPQPHDNDRADTPLPTNLHQNYYDNELPPTHENMSSIPNPRFHHYSEHLPSNHQTNWHNSNRTASPIQNNNNWLNGPYGPRSHRKRIVSSDDQSPLHLMNVNYRPPSESSSSTKESFNNKSEVFESDFIPSKKKRKNKSTTDIQAGDIHNCREELRNTTPLPGFQQAFGSTEIGRFSEIFFNAPESPAEMIAFESEGDTLSPQIWETGDSLEGPHINLQIGATVHPMYADSYGSTDSPESSSYFSDIRCNDY